MKTLLMTALTLTAVSAHASQYPLQPTCDIIGKVLKIEKRDEPGRGSLKVILINT